MDLRKVTANTKVKDLNYFRTHSKMVFTICVVRCYYYTSNMTVSKKS